jgi:hypothetical protein
MPIKLDRPPWHLDLIADDGPLLQVERPSKLIHDPRSPESLSLAECGGVADEYHEQPANNAHAAKVCREPRFQDHFCKRPILEELVALLMVLTSERRDWFWFDDAKSTEGRWENEHNEIKPIHYGAPLQPSQTRLGVKTRLS